MNITVKVEATELADAINNLSQAIVNILAARAEVKADQVIEKASRKKPQPEVGNTGSSGSAVTPSPASDVPPPEAAAPLTASEVQRLAALKAKKVGPAVIRGLVADTNFTQIADIDNPEVLRALSEKLEAL